MVIILLFFFFPVLGSNHWFEKFIEKQFVKVGYATMIVNFYPEIDFTKAVTDLHIHDKALYRSIKGIELLLEELKKFPSIDTDQVVLMGMSLGGTFTALNILLNKKIKAAVIVAGSGNNPHILANSKNPIIAALRKKRMAQYSMSSEKAYLNKMKRKMRWDPLLMKRSKVKDKILMIISMNDTDVLTSAQIKTWKFFGRPKAIFSKLGHFPLILSVPFLYNKKIIQFFNEKLSHNDS